MLGQAQAGRIGSGYGAVARQGNTDGLGKAVHGVGRKHAGTGAAARTGTLLHLLQFLCRGFACLEAADSLENSNEVGCLVGTDMAGQHGAARDED